MLKIIDHYVISILFGIKDEKQILDIYNEHLLTLDELANKTVSAYNSANPNPNQEELSQLVMKNINSFNEVLYDARISLISADDKTNLEEYLANMENMLKEQDKLDELVLEMIEKYKKKQTAQNPPKINLGGVTSNPPTQQTPVQQISDNKPVQSDVPTPTVTAPPESPTPRAT